MRGKNAQSQRRLISSGKICRISLFSCSSYSICFFYHHKMTHKNRVLVVIWSQKEEILLGASLFRIVLNKSTSFLYACVIQAQFNFHQIEQTTKMCRGMNEFQGVIYQSF